MKTTKTFKSDIWENLDVLEALDKPYMEIYYQNEAISDYKKKPYEFFIFIRTFKIHKTPKGKYVIKEGNDVVRITGNSHKEIETKLERYIDTCDGMVPTDERQPRTWVPIKWQNIKKAVKIFNLQA